MMKQMFTIVAAILMVSTSCFSQCDDKFYFPSKEWSSIEDVDYSETYFHIDNDTLYTVLLKSEISPKATIIFYHGTGGNISSNASFAKRLTHEGYQVLMIDFRGYGRSTGKPTHVNIANDAQVIFDKMIMSDELQNYPVIIFGASIGTQIATKIAKDNQDEISAIILDGAMSSFTDMALLSAPEAQKEMIAAYVTSPYSAIEDVKLLGSMPKLFIHSRGDRAIPFAQGEAVYSKAAGPKVFWEFEGGHLEAAARYAEEYIRRINALLSDI